MTEQTTTKAGPTPGEWADDGDMDVLGDQYRLIHDGTVTKRGIPAFVALVGPGPNRANDARLISSAPDLLAACEDALVATAEEGRHDVCQYCAAILSEHFPDRHTAYCWVPKVRAAVAKARGQ